MCILSVAIQRKSQHDIKGYVITKLLFSRKKLQNAKVNFEKSITIFEGSTFHGRQNVIDVFFSFLFFLLTQNNQERL